MLYKDVSEILDMKDFVKMDKCFNIPFASYMTGSYFGDNDALLNMRAQRQFTAVSKMDSQLYSVTTSVLSDITNRFPSIKKIMRDIAVEKQDYYDNIKVDIKSKYKNKVMTKILYDEKNDGDWTHYMSIKRERFKKSLATDFALHQLV